MEVFNTRNFLAVVLFLTASISSSTVANEAHKAIEDGDIAKLKSLLEKDSRWVDSTIAGKTTPLHTAATHGKFEAAKLLLEYKARLTAKTEEGFTPLHSAAKQGHAHIVRLFLDQGADPKAVTKEGYNALHFAVAAWSPNAVETCGLLLDKGVNVDVPLEGWRKQAPLYFARKKDMVEFLLQRGANINYQDTEGFTALYMACYGKDLEKARTLLAAKADIELRNKFDGFTPLHVSIKQAFPEIVQILLDNGADINAIAEGGTEKYRRTPLDQALLRDRNESQLISDRRTKQIIPLLKAKGAKTLKELEGGAAKK
jgi:ankyrin repeat protein